MSAAHHVAAARTVAVIANPFSGTGPNQRRVADLIKALEARDLKPLALWEPEKRKAFLTEPGLADRAACIVIAGGDGSIGDTLTELYHSQQLDNVALTTLPVGNENLVARDLGITRDAEALAQAIAGQLQAGGVQATGRTTHVDLGLVESEDATPSRVFTLMCSVGFDADVVRRMDRWRRYRNHRKGKQLRPGNALRRVNKRSYVLRTLGAAKEYQYPRLRIKPDNASALTGCHVFVFNIPQYGGGLTIAPDADPSDGLLDYVVLQKPGLYRLLAYFGSILARAAHLKRGDVHHGRCTSLRIECDPSCNPTPAAQADGDPAPTPPVDIRVLPGAVRFITTR